MTTAWNPLAWTSLPASLLTLWSGRGPSAPQNLDQAILPGWIFGSVVNVTEENSAAPATEAAILRTYSYGRQLGQISDALQVLIDERAKKGGAHDDALDKFATMRTNIDKKKTATATARINRFLQDLESLRQQDPEQYEQTRTRLRAAL